MRRPSVYITRGTIAGNKVSILDCLGRVKFTLEISSSARKSLLRGEGFYLVSQGEAGYAQQTRGLFLGPL
jgi:hypothetical protein